MFVDRLPVGKYFYQSKKLMCGVCHSTVKMDISRTHKLHETRSSKLNPDTLKRAVPVQFKDLFIMRTNKTK